MDWQILFGKFKEIPRILLSFLLGAVTILPIWNYFEKRHLKIYDLESELDCLQYELDQILGEREQKRENIRSREDFPSKETEELLNKVDEEFRPRIGIAKSKINRVKKHLDYQRKWFLWIFNKYNEKEQG